MPDEDTRRIDDSYKNTAYWALPLNVRNAIDLAKSKEKQSEFSKRLEDLNDKIYIYNRVFNNREPGFKKRHIVKKDRVNIEKIITKTVIE